MLAVLGFGVVSGLLQFAMPLFSLAVYDLVIPARSTETLVALFLCVLVLNALQPVIDLARGRILARVGVRLEARLAPGGTGDQLARKGAVLSAFASPQAIQVFDLMWLPVLTLALFLFHPAMGLLGLIAVSVVGGFALVSPSLSRDLQATAERSAANVAAVRLRIRAAADYLAATGSQTADLSLKMAEAAATEAQLQLADRNLALAGWQRAVRGLFQLAAFALGAGLALEGAISGGTIVAASLIFARLLGPVELAVQGWPTLRRTWTAPVSVDAAESPSPPFTGTDPSHGASIRVSGACVLSPAGQMLLGDISFAVSAGQALAVIGPAGSGKTTLARVLTGALPVTDGQVRIAGMPPGTAGAARMLGYLPENPRFLAGTVAGNVAGGQAGSAAVARALSVVGLDAAVARLPQGAASDVVSAEGQFSGAELRRLALARAIVGEPCVLILDDPDAGADADGLARLASVVRQARARGAAIIVLSRQAGAAAGCDRILFMDQGRLRAAAPSGAALHTIHSNADQPQPATRRKSHQ